MMRYVIEDTKYCFKYAFDTETGAYVRTGILDDKGRDTGKDPFQASFPHLIDVGIMGHCKMCIRDRDKGGKEDAHYVPNQSYQRLEQLWIPDQ